MVSKFLLMAFLVVSAAVPAFAGKVHIQSPVAGETLRGPNVAIQFHVDEACPEHCPYSIRLILDDGLVETCPAKRSSHVFKALSGGTHTVRAFLVDCHGVSDPCSLGVVTFNVDYCTDENRLPAGRPFLTCNLPQGEYVGKKASDITLDFMVHGADLSPNGYRVAYYVDGRRFLATDMRPRHLQNLGNGSHNIRLELLDNLGNLVDGPYNSVERTIHVDAEASPAMEKKGPGKRYSDAREAGRGETGARKKSRKTDQTISVREAQPEKAPAREDEPGERPVVETKSDEQGKAVEKTEPALEAGSGDTESGKAAPRKPRAPIMRKAVGASSAGRSALKADEPTSAGTSAVRRERLSSVADQVTTGSAGNQ